MSLQTITLWTLKGHAGTPNPWKVLMILEELKLPYEPKLVDLADLKKEPYESINPNGRVPALEDPNTGITIWESGAILEYLVDTYDKEHTISFPAGSKSTTKVSSGYTTRCPARDRTSGRPPGLRSTTPRRSPVRSSAMLTRSGVFPVCSTDLSRTRSTSLAESTAMLMLFLCHGLRWLGFSGRTK